MSESDSNSETSASENTNAGGQTNVGCWNKCKWEKCSIIAFAIVVALSIVGVYHKTLLYGTPISKLDLITQLDILYNPDLKGVTVSVSQDPSACTQSIPKESFIQASLRKFQSPIWNPNSGCGQPIIADPSNTLWDPVDLFFSADDQASYNRGLLLKIVLGGLAAYFYFFRVGAAPWAAATAAIGYALTARILYQTELPTNIMTGIFLVFSFLDKDSSLKRILLCALALSFCYVGIHPELFFVGTCSAVAVWFLSDSKKHVSLLRSVGTMALTGIATIALVGPFLFSFLEYMRYAHTYKYAASALEFIPLSQLAYFFYSAKIPNTYFPGLVLLLGLPVGIFVAARRYFGVFLVITACLLFACRPGPLETIFAQAPFSYLLPDYVLRPVHLLACMFCGLGLTQLSKIEAGKFKTQIGLLIASALLAILPLILIRNGIAPEAFQIGFTPKLFLSTAIIVGIATFCLLVVNKGKFGRIAAFAIPFLNLALVIPPAHTELPYSAPVPLPPANKVELVKTLQSYPGARFSACGDRLIQPNTGLFFGLADLRTCSPLNHARYLNFMEALGANLGYCNLMHLPPEISPLANLASVKLLVSNTPIHSANFVANPKDFLSTSIKEGRIMSGMRIMGGHCDYSQSAAEINCHLNLRIHENLYGRYQAAVLLQDSNGTELWRSPLIVFGPSKTAAHESPIDMSIPAPHKSKNSVKVLLVIRDAWTGSDVNADGLSLELHDGKSVLATFELQSTDKVQSSDGRFNMLYESADLIRVYENVTALPNAFLVHKIKLAGSDEEALSMLKSSSFDPRAEAIVEGKAISLTPKEQVKDSLLTLSTTNTELQFESDSASDSLLVNTGLNYPGWKVFVDGKQEPLLQANYLFRGVKLASGHHLIRFIYEPMSFIAGCLTSLLCLLACLFVLIYKPKEPE